MGQKMVDVTLHIDEDTTPDERAGLRDQLLRLNGVMKADFRDTRPHLMIVEYDPDLVASSRLLEVTEQRGYHAELIGM